MSPGIALDGGAEGALDKLSTCSMLVPTGTAVAATIESCSNCCKLVCDMAVRNR